MRNYDFYLLQYLLLILIFQFNRGEIVDGNIIKNSFINTNLDCNKCDLRSSYCKKSNDNLKTIYTCECRLGFERDLKTNKCVIIKKFPSSSQVYDGGTIKTNNQINNQFYIGSKNNDDEQLCNLGQSEKHATRCKSFFKKT